MYGMQVNITMSHTIPLMVIYQNVRMMKQDGVHKGYLMIILTASQSYQ